MKLKMVQADGPLTQTDDIHKVRLYIHEARALPIQSFFPLVSRTQNDVVYMPDQYVAL